MSAGASVATKSPGARALLEQLERAPGVDTNPHGAPVDASEERAAMGPSALLEQLGREARAAGDLALVHAIERPPEFLDWLAEQLVDEAKRLQARAARLRTAATLRRAIADAPAKPEPLEVAAEVIDGPLPQAFLERCVDQLLRRRGPDQRFHRWSIRELASELGRVFGPTTPAALMGAIVELVQAGTAERDAGDTVRLSDRAVQGMRATPPPKRRVAPSESGTRYPPRRGAAGTVAAALPPRLRS